MKRSLGSLAIVLTTLFVAFLGTWIYLRFKAQSKPLKPPFEHAFLASAHDGGRKLLLLRLTSPTELETLPPQTTKFSTGAWLDVRLGGEGQLAISPGELLDQGPFKGKPIEIATRAECREAGLFELADFYPKIGSHLLVLNLISRRPGLAEKILEDWKDLGPLRLSQTLMQSESDGTLKELREKQPKGLFGSSQATLIQMEILGNLDLNGLTDLKADVLVSSTEEIQHGGGFTARVRPATLEEAHRRGLKRYAGPVRTKESAQELLTAGYDGVMIEGAGVFASLIQ